MAGVEADRDTNSRDKVADKVHGQSGEEDRGYVWGAGAVTSLQTAFYRGIFIVEPLQSRYKAVTGRYKVAR